MKKKLIIAAAVGAVAAAAVPAMALENEFHGMYKFMGFQSNFFVGEGSNVLEKDANSGFMAEQRARINYIAKANDNLKLVTHFELDSRFGGKSGTYLGAGNDGGNLDADQLTLETKNIFLDFNCPITSTNMKVGLQPWADAYGSIFLLADMTGVYATKKVDAFTGSLGWFRFDDNSLNTATTPNGPGDQTADMIVLDTKYAVNKDMKVGFTYYNVQNDTKAAQPTGDSFELLHTFGLNADMTFGTVNIKPGFMYQMGEKSNTEDTSGFAFEVVGKAKVGPGAINFSAIYLSGDDDQVATEDDKDFKAIAHGATYFNPANMWFLVRNGQQINSSTSVLGNDLSAGNRGLIGLFAGYEGTADKIFYNANIGYAMTAETTKNAAGVETEDSIGTEINAQVGYKLFDNLTASVAVAYIFLGDALTDDVAAKRIGGGADADDAYMFNMQLSYVF